METRKKSSALLYIIIMNSESNITQHTQLIVDTIYKAATDDEKLVIHYVSIVVISVGPSELVLCKFCVPL